MSPTVARCYMRVSTDEQVASGYSLAGQREKLELFAQLQGYAIGGWYRDDGVSAKDLNRPEFQRLMAEAGRGDVILVYKLDRLTRSVRDLDDLLRTFEARELHFRSVTEQFDTTTATGRLMIRMVAEFAQWERETIAERTAFGKQKKAAAGEWGGGRPPFGYTLAPSDRVKGGRTLMKLVPDPARAHLVGAIFERYLAGHGVRAIATWLNTEMGARSALGRPWDGVKVARMLQNPVYLGVIATGRTGSGQRGLVPSTHPPLVAASIFHQVQAMFKARKQMAPRQATGCYPLSGIAVCGVCGGPIRVQHASRSDRYYYGCRSHATGRGCGVPPLTSAPGPTMEAMVAEAIAPAISSPVHLERFWMQLVHEAAPVADDTSRMLTDLAEAERAIARWDRLYETGILTEEEYVVRAAPHRARLRLLRERLRQAPASPPQREGPGPYVIDFPAAWAAAEPAERKMLLQHFASAWGVVVGLLPGQGLAVSHARIETQEKSGKP